MQILCRYGGVTGFISKILNYDAEGKTASEMKFQLCDFCGLSVFPYRIKVVAMRA